MTSPPHIVFVHGLESKVDEALFPTGKKASWLREAFGAATPAIDTRRAREVNDACEARGERLAYPYARYEEGFETPLRKTREAITGETAVVIGSSFGGAVLLRLLHEAPRWQGPAIFLAGAGPKLTPYDTLPPGIPCLLVHGTGDDIVPFADSAGLAATSPDAELWAVDDDHRLQSILDDGTLQRAIDWALARGRH